MNPTLNSIIKNALVVKYKVSPTPRSLSDTLLIYRGVSELGNIIQFRGGLCPVTKRRTDDLRVVFHDVKDDESGNSVLKDRLGSKTHTIQSSDGMKKFDLKVDFISSDEDQIKLARTLSAAKYFKVKDSHGDVAKMERSIETRKNEVLEGFNGLF